MDRRVDAALAVLVVALGVFLVVASFGIRPGSVPDPFGSGGLPRVAGVMFIVGGAVLAGRRAVELARGHGRLAPSEGKDDEPGFPASGWRAIHIWLALVAAGIVLLPLGYILTVLGVTFWTLRIMRFGSIRSALLLASIFSISSWALFELALGVRLPRGVLAPLIDLIL